MKAEQVPGAKVYVNIFKLGAGWSEQLCALITPESF